MEQSVRPGRPKVARAEIIGIKRWKRWQIDAFLRDRYDDLHYAGDADAALRGQASNGGDIVVWASRETPDLAARAAAQDARLIRIEDGFLRSVGLGSNHIGGASLVLDPVGIYFDPRRPSALEALLQRGGFDAATLARAARLREAIVRGGLSKYNVGRRDGFVAGGLGRKRLLVPGQVEDDASVRCGCPGVRSNLDLLRQVREAEPDSWILYKPHPDTEAGTRSGAIGDDEVLRYADQVVHGVSAVALFSQVDAVHTMTSLLGFEALLRRVPVTVWGQPFYAGWGLTNDRLPLPRRSRECSLDELVAAALIAYPVYVHPRTRQACSPEDLVSWLEASAAADADRERSGVRRMLQLCHGLYRSWMSSHGRA